MKKSDLLRAAAVIGATAGSVFIPGAGPAIAAVGKVVGRSQDDDDDDVDDTTSAILQVILGKDSSGVDADVILADPVLQLIAQSVRTDLALFQRLLVERHGARAGVAAQPVR